MSVVHLVRNLGIGTAIAATSWGTTLSLRSAESENLADSANRSETDHAGNQPFHEELLKVAAEYKNWGRVDDEMRWAPWLCRAPEPGRAYLSDSDDQNTHGQKLYSLFARNRDEYFSFRTVKPAAVGQVIVKESWVPEEVTDSAQLPGKQLINYSTKVVYTPDPNPNPKRRPLDFGGDHFLPYAWKGTRVFKATTQADLFIMMKLDPKTPGTDGGWVYATVTADGKRVTSAGRVASCMKCHQEAKNDRML